MRKPTRPWQSLALLASGAYASFIVTTYALDNFGDPVRRLDRAISSLSSEPDYPSALYARQSLKCENAWKALSALQSRTLIHAQRGDVEAYGGAFLRDYALVQITPKCTTAAQAAHKAASSPL